MTATVAPRRTARPKPPTAATIVARTEPWLCAALALLVGAELWIGFVRTAALYAPGP